MKLTQKDINLKNHHNKIFVVTLHDNTRKVGKIIQGIERTPDQTIATFYVGFYNEKGKYDVMDKEDIKFYELTTADRLTKDMNATNMEIK